MCAHVREWYGLMCVRVCVLVHVCCACMGACVYISVFV